MAFAGLSIIAALNARSAPVATMIDEAGLQNAIYGLFGVSVVIWFALYAAWTIAVTKEAAEPYRRGDSIVLLAMIGCIALPLPILSIGGGFTAGLWLLFTSQKGSAARRMAIILTAITAQQIFGRLFMTLFSQAILAADIFLVDIFSGFEGQGNVLTRPDGSNMIVAAGCSSINNMSYALLAWVTVAQLFKLRLDKRLAGYVALSLIAIFLLNTLRLLMMGWYPAHFDFIHVGGGAAMFSWAGFILLAVLAGMAVLALAPRNKPA
jgi:exosortase/archaeosortase family protein